MYKRLLALYKAEENMLKMIGKSCFPWRNFAENQGKLESICPLRAGFKTHRKKVFFSSYHFVGQTKKRKYLIN